jgi:3-hydroxyisobutyrate dehydrogenase
MNKAYVGFAGLGAMGEPMAANLARAGLLKSVWNRSIKKAEVFADQTNVAVSATLAELAQTCEVILLCVSADDDVKSVVSELLPHLNRQHIIIDCSTVSRATACEVVEHIKKTGADFIDAPVSGGVEGARHGTLVMMVGGEAATLERVRPVLEVISSRIAHMGPAGTGQATKAVNQVMAAGINQAVTEALAFAQAQHLDMEKVIDVIAGGAAGNWFLHHRGSSMAQNIFTPGFKVSLHQKDLEICKAMAAELDCALPVVEMTLVHYARLIQAGFGEEDISALFREKQRLFDKK